jgi:hypothetical protein
MMMTCRQDHLPARIANKLLHKESTSNGDKQARVGRFNNPITLVKTVTIPIVIVGSDTPGKVTAVDTGANSDASDTATGATINL